MISPTELRIGNRIKFIDGIKNGEYITVELIDFRNECEFPYEDSKYFDRFEPIPLTSEILIKCGFIFPFEKDGEFAERSYHLKMYSLWEVTGNIPSYWQLKIGNNFTNTSIQFLHQLQNLYHALTGTELEINL